MYLRKADEVRNRVLDAEWCGVIYHRFLEYIRDPETGLSEYWGPPRVPPVYQYQMDTVDDEGHIANPADFAFILGLTAIRKRDGADFYMAVRLPLEIKDDWENILQCFHALRKGIETYAHCLCTSKEACAEHRGGQVDTAVLSVQ